jgi:hypothetical protein
MPAVANQQKNIATQIVAVMLAASSGADDRIAFTNRASLQDGIVLVDGPIRFKHVQRRRKWDQENL